MNIKTIKKFLCFLLCGIFIGNVFPANMVEAEKEINALTYHVGVYDMFPESDGSLSVTIGGKKYYYSDGFDAGEIATKISQMENQNVVYELHDNKIVKVYTMDEVLYQEVTVQPQIKDGLIYRKGKFNPQSFDLVVKVSNKLQGDFQKNDLLWFLNDSEKGCLYSSLKKLEIKPSDNVDFGSSGWWIWKDYETTISENLNDVVRAEETKEYKYTVNLHNDGVVNQPRYNIIIYATTIFDNGTEHKVEGKIPIGNLDYQEEKTEEKKTTSNAGQSVTQAQTKLDGISNAIQFTNNLFSDDQKSQINEFVNIWMSELLLAKYVEKSELQEYISKKTEEIANIWLKKLGVDTSVLVLPGNICATTYLETQTKDGTKVFIEFNINLLNFEFGNSGMPTMATGSGKATVYNMNGEVLDSSVILPSYADLCAFCEQLQSVAKDTIFSSAKEYLGIFGKSAEGTAEELSTIIMEKILNNKYAKNVFKRVNAKDVKNVLEKLIVDGEKKINNKIFQLVTTPSQERTQVSIKCPVDVNIYDNDGNLCGVIKDNVVDTTYDDIFINVVGDQKNINLIGDDYSFEMIGTDDGSMDYVVREFDDDGNTTREITYENIKLSNGCKYYSYVPEAVNHSSILFDLTDSHGNIISPTTGADIESDIDNISNKCGENVFWELSDDGLLRIYGNGNMYDYSTSSSGSGEPGWKLYNDQITEVVIEEGITNIGSAAFSGCSALTSITIPESVRGINDYAFYKCSSLNFVLLPNSIESMGENVFNGCDGLKTAGSIGGDYNIQFGWEKKIPDNAFFGCFSLESIDIPETVTTIGASSFRKSGLKNLELKKNIEEIGEYAFSYCSYLENIYYDIISLEKDREAEYTYTQTVFQGTGTNTDGASVVIGDDVTDIPDYIFYGPYDTVNIKNLEIGKNVEYIGISAFSYCRSIQKLYYNARHVISYDHNDAYSYSKRGPFNCCSAESGLELIIGDDVEYIPSNIFRTSQYYYYNYGIYADFECKKITLGKNVNNINLSFIGFTELEEFEVSAENNSFSEKDGVLYDKEKKTLISYPAAKSEISFILPDSVTTIGEKAFLNCSNLESLELDDALDTIGKQGISYCDKLTKVIVKQNILELGQFVFRGCDKLQTMGPIGENYNIQVGVMQEIQENAFHALENLTSVVIPKGVISIGSSAFKFCSNLNSVEILEGVTKIGTSAFGYCSGLTSIIIPQSVTEIGDSAFYGCSSLTDITIPAGVTRISDDTFRGCSSLTSVTIPEGVTEIGKWAFAYCSLTSITIPESVTEIGVSAFIDCDKLTTIKGKKGSYAETDANENGYQFVDIDGDNTVDDNNGDDDNQGDNNPILMGDLDGNKKIDLNDAKLLLKGAVGIITLTEQQQKAGDINNDTKINLNDAKMLLRIAVGIPN